MASLLLTTESFITEIPKEDEKATTTPATTTAWAEAWVEWAAEAWVVWEAWADDVKRISLRVCYDHPQAC